MKKLLALLLLGLCPFFAQATTYYISDCQTGADAACVAGSNSNAGTVSTSPKQTYTQITPSPGDVINLANGGSWIISTVNTVTCATCAAGNSVTWQPFVPTWCVSTCASGPTKPLITVTGTSNSSWVFGTNPTKFSGATLKGLSIQGTGLSSQVGILLNFVNGDDITVDGLDIGFGNLSINLYSYTNRFILRNSKIHDGRDIGFFGGGNEFLVENNIFDNNGGGQALLSDAARSHNVYISCGYQTGGGGAAGDRCQGTIRGNTLTRASQCNISGANCVGGVGTCVGVEMVVHRQAQLIIENNTINDTADGTTTNGAGDGCYGIGIQPGDAAPQVESYAGSIVRGNKVINTGANAIDIQACPYCLIENNIISYTDATHANTVFAIMADNSQNDGTDDINTSITIRNNSIYQAGTSAGNVGINITFSTTGNQVFNNVIYYASATSASSSCYKTVPSVGSFTIWDYNLCYRVGGANVYSTSYATLALAQTATLDVHGSVSNPTLAAAPASGNSYDIAFTSGLTKNGGTSPCPKTTYGGYSRASLGTCDIGAHQQGASVLVPNSPTWAH